MTSECPGRGQIRHPNPQETDIQYAINPAISLPGFVSFPKFDDPKLLKQLYPHNHDVFILQSVPRKCVDVIGTGRSVLCTSPNSK